MISSFFFQISQVRAPGVKFQKSPLHLRNLYQKHQLDELSRMVHTALCG